MKAPLIPAAIVKRLLIAADDLLAEMQHRAVDHDFELQCDELESVINQAWCAHDATIDRETR